MADVEDLRIRSFEELLWDKVVKMSQAKEMGNEYFFDELLEEAEMLIKLVPEIHQRFEQQKNQLDKLVDANLTALKIMSTKIDDDITRDLLKTQKTALIKWEFRNDMLEAVLQLLNDFQMIPFANPALSGMLAEYEGYEEEEPEEPAEIEEEEPPLPPTQQQAPPPQQLQQPKANIEQYPNMGKKVKIQKPRQNE